MFLKPYPLFSCPSGDGRNFILQDYLIYEASDGTTYRGLKGASSDGASTPFAIWSLFPPFGKYWIAAVLHDCGYRCMLEQLINGVWARLQLDKDRIDWLFKDAMQSLGVDEHDIYTIYEAVKNAGADAFLADLAQPIV